MSTNRKRIPYTFIVLKDRKRPALRFQLGRAMLLSVPLSVLALVLACIWLYTLYEHHDKQSQLLQAELDKSIASFSEIVQQKDQTIEQLQDEFISLSYQAQEVQQKVEQLLELESELDQIAESAQQEMALSVDPKQAEVTLSSYRDEHSAAAITHTAVGGQSFPIEASNLNEVATAASRQFTSLLEEMEDLDGRLESKKKLLEQYRAQLRVTPTIWPTDSRRVTSHYGYRSDPFTRALSMHTGIDIGGSINDPIYATADGVVVASAYDRLLGHHVKIDHGSGLQTVYMHLNERISQLGDTVQKGDMIGRLGSTGRSTGPHLHYEINVDGSAIDPRVYLPSSHKGGT